MHQQCREGTQADADQRDHRLTQAGGELAIVNLRIHCQQRAAVKQKQRSAKKEKYPLEIALPPVAEDHHHPEQRQQRACRQPDQTQINDGIHSLGET
jgi:hypothetical protein